MEIKGEWEDLIYEKQRFIQELEQVQHKYYDKLLKKLKKDGFPDELEERLFDFIFNCEEELEFEEYLSGYKKSEEYPVDKAEKSFKNFITTEESKKISKID